MPKKKKASAAGMEERALEAIRAKVEVGKKLTGAELAFLEKARVEEEGPRTFAELAKEVGEGERTLRKWRAQGCPGLDKPFDAEAAREWIAARKRGGGDDLEGLQLMDAQALHQIEQIKLKRLEYQKRVGEVIAVDDVKAELGDVLGKLTDALVKGLPAELVTIVRGAPREAVARDGVRKRIEKALADFTKRGHAAIDLAVSKGRGA